jgi:ribosomal protein S18 acetylase RimI-like enzyme
MKEDIAIRAATLDDVATIIHQRHQMFVDMGVTDGAGLARMDNLFEPWVRERLASGEYAGWLATIRTSAGVERSVAGSGLLIYNWVPSVFDPIGRRGYVLNVYTDPAYRGRGLARKLVDRTLEHARAQGLYVVSLHASEMGRSIYESLGFGTTNEMRIRVRD